MLTKFCTKCCETKEIDCFSKDKNKKDGLSFMCKSCFADYRKQNKESISAKEKIRYRQNREAKIAYSKQYRNHNSEAVATQLKRYREKNREAVAARLKRWQQNNRDKCNAVSAQYRSTKLMSTPSWIDHETVNGMYYLASIFNRTGISLHVDHIVPLTSSDVCGLHCESNLQLLPSSSNISKGNRWWPDMW